MAHPRSMPLHRTSRTCVFTDWEMPLINGIDMTKLMRASDNSVNPYVPIIMVTVHSERHRVPGP